MLNERFVSRLIRETQCKYRGNFFVIATAEELREPTRASPVTSDGTRPQRFAIEHLAQERELAPA